MNSAFIAVTTVNTTDAIVGVHLHPRAAAHKSEEPSRTRELAKSVLYDAPPSLVASVNEAINNGKLKERLLYWADHFDADWADDLAPAAGPANNAMTQLNSGLHGKVGSIEKWLLIVIVVLGAVCLLCCVCCIIHVGTCGIL